jgi:hypothetical protein
VRQVCSYLLLSRKPGDTRGQPFRAGSAPECDESASGLDGSSKRATPGGGSLSGSLSCQLAHEGGETETGSNRCCTVPSPSWP